MTFPLHLTERVRDGVLSLARVPLATLAHWSREAERPCDRDTLGCEIMYRQEGSGR